MKGIKEWFPLYAGDWITSLQLRMCSPVERAVLIDLMAFSWEAGTPGVIKEDIKELAYFLHIDSDELSNALAMLKQRRRIEYDGETITINRLQEVAREQHSKHQKRVNAGKKGGAVKKETDDDDKQCLAMLKHSASAMLSNAQSIEEKREEENREEKSETRAREEAPTPDLNIGTFKGEVLLMWKQLEELAPRRITKSEKARMVPALSRIMKDIGTKQAFLKVWSKAMKHDNASKWLGHPDWLEKDFGQFLPKKAQTAIPAESLILRKEGKRDFAKMFKDKQAKEAYIASHKLKVVAGFGEAAVYEVAE